MGKSRNLRTKKFVGKKDAAGKPTDKSGSQIRREKAKVSDLIKKLRINYNKLLMKKKDLKITGEQKATICAESIELIGDSFTTLIYKHDGCRII